MCCNYVEISCEQNSIEIIVSFECITCLSNRDIQDDKQHLL